MNIIEKNRLDISELKIKFNWDQKTLAKHFPEKDVFKALKNPETTDHTPLARASSLLAIFFLALFVVPYIPLKMISNSLNEGVTNASFYISFTIVGIYLCWLFDRIRQRKKFVDKKSLNEISWKRSLNASDFIPLVIIIVIYLVHFNTNTDSNSILSNDPLAFFLSYGKRNPSTSVSYTDFLLMFMGGFLFYLFIAFFIVIINQVWINPPSKFQKSLDYLVEKKTTPNRHIKESSGGFGIIENEKIFWRIPKIGWKKIEEIECYVSTITVDANLVNLWRLFNPKFIKNLFIGLGIGLYFLYMAFGLIDQIIFGNTEYLASYDSPNQKLTTDLSLIFVFIISLCFMYFVLFSIKRTAFHPIQDYYKLKMHVIKEIKTRISEIYKKVETESKDVGIITELLFLKESLENYQKLPILPFDKPISSLVLLIPLISPYIFLILSNIF